jgi:hypothetical protein
VKGARRHAPAAHLARLRAAYPVLHRTDGVRGTDDIRITPCGRGMIRVLDVVLRMPWTIVFALVDLIRWGLLQS